jgi:type I restriction enzyme S subunit
MAAVDEGQGVIADLQTRPYRRVKRGYTYFEERDVLFAKITPSMQNGKSAIAKGLIDGFGFGSTEFHVLRPSSRVIPEWVYLFVRQRSFRDEAMQHFRGAVGQQRVPAEFLKSYSFPLPPLDEQRHIVARIEELFARIEEARGLRAAADQDAERLIPAALTDMFPYSVDRLSDLWPMGQLGDGDLRTVIPGQHILSSDYSNEEIGVPYLTGPADFGPKFPQISKWTRSPKAFCQPGDVLLTVKGAGVGKVNCAPHVKASIGRQIMALRPNPARLSMDFLFYFLASRFADFQAMGQSATVPGIRKDHVERFGIPLPSLPEQRHIVEYPDGVQAQAAELKRLQAESAAELERLSGAVLARAFRGEL